MGFSKSQIYYSSVFLKYVNFAETVIIRHVLAYNLYTQILGGRHAQTGEKVKHVGECASKPVQKYVVTWHLYILKIGI